MMERANFCVFEFCDKKKKLSVENSTPLEQPLGYQNKHENDQLLDIKPFYN